MPAFLKSRIFIDFSTPEAANSNWERLLRVLFGKPEFEKPELGSPPTYLSEAETRPSMPTLGKFSILREALLNGRPTTVIARKDFITAAIGFADSMRVRERPKVEHIDEKVLADLHALLPLRDQLIDWLMIESTLTTPQYEDILTSFLESVLALKFRPAEINQWQDSWFDAHSLFVYEMFLYIVATLLANDKYNTLHHIFNTHYLLPDSEAMRGRDFVSYDEFYTHSESLEYRNSRLKLQRLSLIADTIKERVTRKDISFKDLIQAELLILLVSLLSTDKRWYPHTTVYASRGGMRFPLFIRAAQHKYYDRIKIITGIESGDELRKQFLEGCERHEVKRWEKLNFWARVSFADSMNMNALDTLK